MTISNKLNNIIKKRNSLLCVGIDPDIEKLPTHLARNTQGIYEFCSAIIQSVHEQVIAFKFNSAFFESQGAEGILVLQRLLEQTKVAYPEIIRIVDAKRGDIGTSSKEYAKFVFEFLNGDAVTVSPYMGQDSIQPFLDYVDRGVIILCRTSNPGGIDLQNLQVEGKPLYLRVAQYVVQHWNTNNNCWLVVGATVPEELAQVRKLAPLLPILVPGVGAQGGDLEKSIDNGLTREGTGLVITISRQIIYASSGQDYAEAAKAQAEKFNQQLKEIQGRLR